MKNKKNNKKKEKKQEKKKKKKKKKKLPPLREEASRSWLRSSFTLAPTSSATNSRFPDQIH